MENSIANSFIPPVEIWTSILAGLSITFFLLVFSRFPFKLPMTFWRFSVSCGSGLVVWMLLLWSNNLIPISAKIEQWIALIAGMLIYLTAIFCNYYLSMTNASFRVEMLNCIAQVDREITLYEWMALYGKGSGMLYFLDDRLKSTLIPWKLAVRNDNQITLTRFGHIVGKINSFLASLFSEK
jgi:hypothetical protein